MLDRKNLDWERQINLHIVVSPTDIDLSFSVLKLYLKFLLPVFAKMQYKLVFN